MTVQINVADYDTDLYEVVQRSPVSKVAGAEEILRQCFSMSAVAWVGRVDGEPACMWGLIPPTILSNQAYLWLLTTDLVEKHKFMFIRHSQRFVEIMLQTYPTIVGHAIVGEDKAIRWLRWLGAEFYKPEGKKIPFQIKARNG